MRLFIVFDNTVDTAGLSSVLMRCKAKQITLFPLTNDSVVLDKVKGTVVSMEGATCSYAETTKIISKKIELLQESLSKWSTDIGSCKVKSREIKGWFLLPGLNVSSWWFSLLSEKNTVKTEVFFHIARVLAVEETLKNGEYDVCAIAVSDDNSRKAIGNAAREMGIGIKIVSSHRYKDTLRHRIIDFFIGMDVPGALILGIGLWLRTIKRGRLARRLLGSQLKRTSDSDFLIVTYFPLLDKQAAMTGVFRNKMVLPLQEKLKELNTAVAWLLITVPFEGYDYKDSIKLAGKFIENGEKLFIIEEFFTTYDAIISLCLWLRQVVLSIYLYRCLKKECLLSEPVGKACEPFLRSLWVESFCGMTGVEGIMFYFIFRRVFSRISSVFTCIYLLEMQAWEKAMNAANSISTSPVRTIGFLHTAISTNQLNYFYDKSETMRTGKTTDMPIPDLIACNGDHIYNLMSESGFPNLTKVEAIRQLYLGKILSSPPVKHKGRPVLLVVGNYKVQESKAMFSMVYRAFPRADRFDIWFKGHPSMPVEHIFKLLDINIDKTGYIIHHGDISQCLPHAIAVLVSSSNVSIEALAYGCEVIVPITADVMLINPLANFREYYHRVYSAEELKETMDRISNGFTLHSINEYRQFVSKYWDLDLTMQKWTELLKRQLANTGSN